MIKLQPKNAKFLTATTARKVLRTFPPASALLLTTEEATDYAVILRKGNEYINEHPESKLTNTDADQEIKVVGAQAVVQKITISPLAINSETTTPLALPADE